MHSLMVNRKISNRMIGYKSAKNVEKLGKKFRRSIGGYAILKTVHSLHFMIVNRLIDPGRLEILAR
jgi:hypothetical protein